MVVSASRVESWKVVGKSDRKIRRCEHGSSRDENNSSVVKSFFRCLCGVNEIEHVYVVWDLGEFMGHMFQLCLL